MSEPNTQNLMYGSEVCEPGRLSASGTPNARTPLILAYGARRGSSGTVTSVAFFLTPRLPGTFFLTGVTAAEVAARRG